jgi:hypothetical protein
MICTLYQMLFRRWNKKWMRVVGHVECMGQMRNSCKFSVGINEGKDISLEK